MACFAEVNLWALREEAHEEEYLRITLELRTALLKLLS